MAHLLQKYGMRLVVGVAVAAAACLCDRSSSCPSAARGFWGCIFIGLMLSTTRTATAVDGATRLVQVLLNTARPDNLIPASLVPVKAPDTAASAAAVAAAAAGTQTSGWLQPGPSRYVTYHTREFLCAVLVLLRCEPLNTGLRDSRAVGELHYQMLKVRAGTSDHH